LFLAVGLLALLATVIYEWRHRDPVVEIKLLKERNFALASILYFIFGFILFGSTVLIPQMLQSLFGYSATDAGLVLGPGALVIVVMAPIVVRLTPRVGANKLIAAASLVIGIAMWCYSSLNLDTDYKTYALVRALQGVGLGFFFVPVSQLAYSYLPMNKNNKASSITNLFRNLGGSFGVAFVTTVLEQRTQFHHSIMAQHLTPSDPGFLQRIDSTAQYLASMGASTADATDKAYGMIAGLAQKQAAMLGSLDCFWLLGVIALVGIPLALMIRKFRNDGKAAGH
jgi:DHA2 family multidrug resistance protein